MKSDLVDISCKVISDDPSKKAIAITDGTTEKLPGGRERLKWFWLPRSQIEIEPKAGHVIITMPEWLALDKGLI